jgi:tRNA A37 threonylcarbamoyladenosine synthetase subunit TsaC/SUA5/YrdC
MATTSVNESGKPSINDYNIIKEEYSALVEEIYAPDDEPTSSLASTVVDITGDKPRVLRVGAITLDMINECLEK